MSQNPSFKSQIETARSSIKECMNTHKHGLQRRLKKFSNQAENIDSESFLRLLADIQSSFQIRQNRSKLRPKIVYPDLPVSDRKEDIALAIQSHQVVIIAGETGSGKTTQIPKICLEIGRGVSGLIGHTQPRRLAARTVADRIAQELDTELGDQVGFKIRFSDQVSESSYIKLMTDGILLAEIQRDRFLKDYDTIIIDEAHERSLNIDFILGYLKQLLPKRPDLKLIITSATIDPERFSTHFDNAPIVQVSGRTYPVEMRYRPFDGEEKDIDQTQAIINAVNELSRESQGDILVFLSGERDIRDTAEALIKQKFRHTDVLPLYARLSAAEQNKIFQSHSSRRIVLATNVAETSLTVPGIKYVIDPGMARISRYSYRSKVQRLPIEAISQASANQRAGRCGRVSEGICIRLYSEEDYQNRAEFTDPEILRTNLASVILQMLALGLGKIDAFPFVQPPDSRTVNDGFRLLEELGATEKKQGEMRMTPLGRQLARLPIDPRYGRMVIEAAKQDALSEVLVIAAGLTIQDPRERPQDKRQAADEKHAEFAHDDSDFLSYAGLWEMFKAKHKALSNGQLRKWCKTHFINYLRMREWQDIVSQLKRTIVELGFRLNNHEADYQAIHISIASGLLSHLGFKDKDKEYLGARNSRFMIFPGSRLSKRSPKWCMVAELVETSRLFGRTAAKIDPLWIEPLAKHLVKYQYSEPHWSKKRGAVQGFQKVLLFGQALVNQRRINYSDVDAILCHQMFIREALVNGETKLNFAFLKHNHQIIHAIEEKEKKSRRRDILVDEENLIEFYQSRIPEHICTEASFTKWWRSESAKQSRMLNFDPNALVKHEAVHVNQFNFPDSWLQGNLTLQLTYHFEPNDIDDGISVIVPLPILNQLTNQGFDWLVPGLRHELIVALIKSLPKRLRRNFVPAPNFADACLLDMPMKDKKGNTRSFIEALTNKLHRMTGVNVEPQEWSVENVPSHLKMNFKIVNEKGELLKQGRDIQALQDELQGKVKQTLQEAATPELEQTGLTEWNFETLQKEYIRKTAGFEVKAYPALVAEKDTVSIKLFEQPHSAEQSHRIGVRKLVKLNIPSPVKYLQEKLPNKAKLGLYFNPFGQIGALIEDCIDAGIDELLSQFQTELGEEIRGQGAFLKACDFVRQEINDCVLRIATKVEKCLTTAHAVQKRMKGSVPLNMISAQGDIKQHLSSLIYTGFVSQNGANRLDDMGRYVEGIARRLDKLPIDPNKDRMHQINIEKVQKHYQQCLSKINPSQQTPIELLEVRWMIEELRISFFAQQLGTAIPISAKRIENHLASF